MSCSQINQTTPTKANENKALHFNQLLTKYEQKENIKHKTKQ
jgi:hypothetical protein